MGSNNSVFSPCYDQEQLSGRNGIEEFGFSSTGPIKVVRKKWSTTTSETISIQPVHLASNRSSVTEFIVNRCESTEFAMKTPERSKYHQWSALSSPGRTNLLEPSDVFLRNSRRDGVNLVSKVRAKSLVNTPKTSIVFESKTTNLLNKDFKETLSNQKNSRDLIKKLDKKKNIAFEPLDVGRSIRKRYYT